MEVVDREQVNAYRIVNTSDDDLVFLCLSSPPYRHEDTEIEAHEE